MRSGAVGGIRQHAHQPVFGDDTGGPSVAAVIGKPIVGEIVMDVIGNCFSMFSAAEL
jgi:hypothetical protein